jgi:hypothetical protein
MYQPPRKRCLAITTKGEQCKREAHHPHAQCVFHLYLIEKRRRETEDAEKQPEPPAP